MQINLHLRSHLKSLIKKQTITVELDVSSTVMDLIQKLIADFGEEAQKILYDETRNAIQVLPIVNHKKSLSDTELHDGDVVILLPPIAGG